jgi:ribonuclease P protein component
MDDSNRAPLRFPRAMRLKEGRQFTAAKETGRRIHRGCLIANWMAGVSVPRSQLGVITSRRLGSAVIRSRARRLLREAFRRHQTRFLQPVILVLVARPSIVGKRFGEVEHDFLAAMRAGGLFS